MKMLLSVKVFKVLCHLQSGMNEFQKLEARLYPLTTLIHRPNSKLLSCSKKAVNTYHTLKVKGTLAVAIIYMVKGFRATLYVQVRRS